MIIFNKGNIMYTACGVFKTSFNFLFYYSLYLFNTCDSDIIYNDGLLYCSV